MAVKTDSCFITSFITCVSGIVNTYGSRNGGFPGVVTRSGQTMSEAKAAVDATLILADGS